MTTNLTGTSGLLHGKVAGILTERDLAINIGSANGVQAKMKFKVLADAPTEVRDPDTGEVIGSVDREKVRVQAAEVYEQFTVCRTYILLRTSGGILAQTGWGMMFAQPRNQPETLKAKDSSYLPPLSEEESYVKKGDRVIQILDDDD